jgi:hypothetical protein
MSLFALLVHEPDDNPNPVVDGELLSNTETFGPFPSYTHALAFAHKNVEDQPFVVVPFHSVPPIA